MIGRTPAFGKHILLYAVIVGILGGCPIMPTMHYSTIQADFDRGEYQKVNNELSDAKIQALDPKLQFNAYTLKAFSEWQTGNYTEARQTAATAMHKSGLMAGPRDKFFLSILPALITADELTSKYQKLPPPRFISIQTYKNDYENGYRQVVVALQEAYNQAPAEVPPSSKDYAHCQRKLALMTWRAIMNNIWDGSDQRSSESMALVKQAHDRAVRDIKATSMGDEIEKEKNYPCPEAKQILAAQGTQ